MEIIKLRLFYFSGLNPLVIDTAGTNHSSIQIPSNLSSLSTTGKPSVDMANEESALNTGCWIKDKMIF